MHKYLVAALLLCCGTAMAQPELEVQVELPKIETGTYHRPYVAVWIENEQQQPVRLVEAWLEKPDWIKDLRRFWRKIGRSEPQLVDAKTGATKGPGSYKVRWDGKDEQGKAVAAGNYVLFVEAAREQGGRNLAKQAFTWDGSAVQIEIKASTELGKIKLTSVQGK
ncbi:MAG: DUF2271 domain-containing protein [Gammaproteobacteria bacterium]|nr:DUF2271 domain-containing protein [Gammaproteobacteria bacterium]MBU2058689.1 DUF2271 domain-containing protein [Gammaproteobacteria bacterium]MBU2177345.1 DUF2271 domain-containing protein [Gammaproteobacteria bacterium]MBU2246053.1 DUF2271 domain-containing protein [Gammaproteobacteria bacterium]MBU2343959.1 DUF2271 domain-containing protein [Gammaproteobacteria bacterium]